MRAVFLLILYKSDIVFLPGVRLVLPLLRFPRQDETTAGAGKILSARVFRRGMKSSNAKESTLRPEERFLPEKSKTIPGENALGGKWDGDGRNR